MREREQAVEEGAELSRTAGYCQPCAENGSATIVCAPFSDQMQNVWSYLERSRFVSR